MTQAVKNLDFAIANIEAGLRKTHGVDNVHKSFSIEPSIAQRMFQGVRDSAEFLRRINYTPVTEMKGQKIHVDVNGMILSRTNTDAGEERTPTHDQDMEGQEYSLEKVEADTHVSYKKLNTWAQFSQLRTLYNNAVRQQIAINQIMVGFHGVSRATTTDPVANPLGQDVFKGWLQQLREQTDQTRYVHNILNDDGTVARDHVRLGSGGDWETLSGCIADNANLLEDKYRDGIELVAIIGREILAATEVKYYESNDTSAQEKDALLKNQRVLTTFGGLQAYRVPHFPARAILLTPFNNLSIYYQPTSVRGKQTDNPNRDRYESYRSMNIDYVVEEARRAVFVENVKLQGEWS